MVTAEGTGEDDGELDEEKLREKQAKREEKLRAAAEKLAKRELAKKLKFSRRHCGSTALHCTAGTAAAHWWAG